MTPTPSSDDEAVRDAFARWVSAQVAAPRDAISLIEHVEISHDYVGLLDTAVKECRAVWRSVPAAARTRMTTPAGAPSDVDPWTAEAVSLRERTIHIAVCDWCAGEKKVRCVPCGGNGKTLCTACNGQRKAYGYASNGAYRLLNCTVCRGKGDVDCPHCRRGIAGCSTCNGEGRLQQWMEVESWQRSISTVHPQSLAAQFGWNATTANDELAGDAELLIDVDASRQLTAGDLGGSSQEWLATLRAEISGEERITRQHLRIARVPMRRVHYRLGNDDDVVAFHGRRLLDPVAASSSAFESRAARLRRLRLLLIAAAIIVAAVSLARGAYFWSIPTFLSLLTCCVALVAIQSAAADWTAARLHTRARVLIAVTSFAVAIISAIAALPSVAHARRLITNGALDDAEAELRVVHDPVPPEIQADLRLARIRQATQIDAARKWLLEIPPTLPQHTAAADAIDQLILRTARDDARTHRWSEAAAALSLLSNTARGRPDALAVAEPVCVAAAREKITQHEWSSAAAAIVAARRAGVAPAALQPLQNQIHSAAVDAAEKAHDTAGERPRLRQRLAAEAR